MQTWLASNRYTGLAMTYRLEGNMAHDAVIICYDGTGRVPAVVNATAMSMGKAKPGGPTLGV